MDALCSMAVKKDKAGLAVLQTYCISLLVRLE